MSGPGAVASMAGGRDVQCPLAIVSPSSRQAEFSSDKPPVVTSAVVLPTLVTRLPMIETLAVLLIVKVLQSAYTSPGIVRSSLIVQPTLVPPMVPGMWNVPAKPGPVQP